MTGEQQIENEQVREDANDVLNASVSYAKRMLRRYGEFGPFGFMMNQDGDVKMESIAQQDMPAEPRHASRPASAATGGTGTSEGVCGWRRALRM